MSIDMYLEESRAQADSTWQMAQEEVVAYEELAQAIESFENSADQLKGKAYDQPAATRPKC